MTNKSSLNALRAQFVEEVAVTSRRLRTLFNARVRARGLTLARARTLIYLSRKDGMLQIELAEMLEIEAPTAGRLLDWLEAQDLIERRPMEGDRRAKQIILTEEGRKLAAELNLLSNEIREEVLAGIPEQDLRMASQVLRTVIQKIPTVAGSESDSE